MSDIREVRCPVGFRKLFLRLQGQSVTYVEGVFMELACSDCARESRQQGKDVRRVLHRYNILGEHVQTIEVTN
jgi:hypothetical protein